MASFFRPFLYDPTNGIASTGDLIRVVCCEGQPFGSLARGDAWTSCVDPVLPLSRDEPTTAAETWAVGDPLPAPRSLSEKLNRERMVQLPDFVYQRLWAMEIVRQGNPPQLRREKVEPLLNKLGSSFSPFFERPRPLTDEERAAFVRWRSEAPAIGMIALYHPSMANPLSGGTSMPAEDVYAIMPLYGKFQIIAAAVDARDGNTTLAAQRLDGLQSVLDRLTAQNRDATSAPDPFEQRVHGELSRLIAATREALALPDLPKTTPSRAAAVTTAPK